MSKPLPPEKPPAKATVDSQHTDDGSAAMTRHALDQVMNFLLTTSDRMREARAHCAVIDDELWRQARHRKGDAYKHSTALRRQLEYLLAIGVRVGGEIVRLDSLSPATHRFKGIWRPPERPPAPEELDCSAIICTCKVALRDAKQVKQHWQSGCFDCPEFERLPDGS